MTQKPAPSDADAFASSPEVQISYSPVGRETLALISEELGTPSSGEPATAVPAIFEMLTFVVQGHDPAALASEALRRRFVEERLLARLPASGMASVERVDVTPWTVPGTLVVRVWCRI